MDLSTVISHRFWYVLFWANLLFAGGSIASEAYELAFLNVLTAFSCYLAYLINKNKN